MDPLSDNELMMKVKSGDIARLGLLFERHHRPLFGFFYRATQQQALSEDLVQNVFEKILKNRKQFKGYGKFSTWMFSIAHHELADHFKRSSRRPDKAAMKQDTEHKDHDPGFLEHELHRDELNLLSAAMLRLDNEKRRLLALSKGEGLSYREIGEITGISEGAARVKVFRALQELRSIYQQIEKQLTS